MGESDTIKSKIELAIENLSKAEITYENYEKYSRDIETINSMLDTAFEQQLKALVKPNEDEDYEDKELQRQNKRAKDPQLAEKIANKIKDIRQEKITILDDIRENRTLLNKINYLAQAKFATALSLVHGMDIAEKLTDKTIKITDSIFTRVDNLRARDVERLENFNQKQLELIMHGMGEICARISIPKITSDADANLLKNKIEELQKERNELSNKVLETETKIVDFEKTIADLNASLTDKGIDSKKSDEIKGKISAIESKIAVSEIEQNIAKGKEELKSGEIATIQQALPESKKPSKYDEAYFRNEFGEKPFLILCDYLANPKDMDAILKKYDIRLSTLKNYIYLKLNKSKHSTKFREIALLRSQKEEPNKREDKEPIEDDKDGVEDDA